MFCDNLDGWDEVGCGREVKRKGTYVYLWLIPVDVWHKLTQNCNLNSQSTLVNWDQKVSQSGYYIILLEELESGYYIIF